MTRHPFTHRGGFTLIELLVVMAILAGIAAATVVVAFWAFDRDRAATAVNLVVGGLEKARARAHSEGAPCGIRIINTPDLKAVSFQLIQSPPVFVPSRTTTFSNTAGTAPPYVQFEYTLDGGGQVAPTQTAPLPRQCRIYGLSAADRVRVVPNSTLQLPELGTWHRIESVDASNASYLTLVLNDPTLQSGYPDAELGAATHLRTYNFGLFGPPESVLGEEVVQLPQYSCIDLRPGFSLPAGNLGADYDILFAPSGALVSVPPPSPNTGAYGHVFLWVHDPERGDQTSPATILRDGGEQLLIVIKAQSGGVGGAPVDHGGAVTGDFYSEGRKAID